MKPVYLAVLGTLALAAGGCVGEFTTGGPPTDINPPPSPPSGADAGTAEPEPTGDDATAKVLFDSNVGPVVTLQCGSSGCHGATAAPLFGSDDPLTAYDRVIAQRDSLFPNFNVENSRLIENGTNGHQGANFSSSDVDAISAWLLQEQADVAAGGGQNAPSLPAIWSGCMTQENLDLTGFGDAWADKGTGDGDCDTCHQTFEGNFLATNQNARLFRFIAGVTPQSASHMTSYFTVNADNTEMVINRARIENVANRIAPHEAHPGFTVDGNAMEALQEFYDLTLARKAAGLCDDPRF